MDERSERHGEDQQRADTADQPRSRMANATVAPELSFRSLTEVSCGLVGRGSAGSGLGTNRGIGRCRIYLTARVWLVCDDHQVITALDAATPRPKQSANRQASSGAEVSSASSRRRPRLNSLPGSLKAFFCRSDPGLLDTPLRTNARS
ncbi:MAG: hypothetical protein ACLPLP_11415 [Mycobacterium sp.]